MMSHDLTFARANVDPRCGFAKHSKIFSIGSMSEDLPHPRAPMQATFTPRSAPISKARRTAAQKVDTGILFASRILFAPAVQQPPQVHSLLTALSSFSPAMPSQWSFSRVAIQQVYSVVVLPAFWWKSWPRNHNRADVPVQTFVGPQSA